MSFAYAGRDRFYFGAEASLIETDRLIASDWATPHIILNPANAWILGKYVEADNPNKNQHYFGLDTLRDAKVSISHAPLNINHKVSNVVGAFVASEMIYPTGEPVEAEITDNPFIESLAVMWKYYFKDAYKDIQAAAEGPGLFFSMECLPQYVSTVGGSDDEKLYPFEGVQSPTYPEELNSRAVPMRIHNPFFVGGALVLPPANPAWSKADAKQISAFLKDHWDEAESLYAGIEATAPELSASEWEAMMFEVLMREIAKDYSMDQRSQMAKSGHAMPDGSFPIANVADLKNAIKLAGQSKHPDAARAHIKTRAKALGQMGMIPADW